MHWRTRARGWGPSDSGMKGAHAMLRIIWVSVIVALMALEMGLSAVTAPGRTATANAFDQRIDFPR